MVIEKAARLGYHTLSGAVFEADCLDELMPGWRESGDSFVKSMVKIERDELFYLNAKKAHRVPRFAIPKGMRHDGDYTIALGRMVDWLGRLAEEEGVEIYTGFAGGKLLMENGRVQGIKLVDLGLDREGKPKPNYLEGEDITADVTILADGARHDFPPIHRRDRRRKESAGIFSWRQAIDQTAAPAMASATIEASIPSVTRTGLRSSAAVFSTAWAAMSWRLGSSWGWIGNTRISIRKKNWNCSRGIPLSGTCSKGARSYYWA